MSRSESRYRLRIGRAGLKGMGFLSLGWSVVRIKARGRLGDVVLIVVGGLFRKETGRVKWGGMW